MSQASGNHKSTNLLSCLKAEVNARALDERVDQTLGREPWTIDLDDRVNKQGGECARFVRAQRAVA